MVRDEVCVAGREAAVERDLLVGLAVAVGVAQAHDVRLRHHDDAVLGHAEAGDEFEPFVKDGLFVHDAVAVGVLEDADAVARGAVVAAGLERAGFLPRLGAERAAAIRILGRLGDPEASTRVPLDGDGLGDERLGGDDRGAKARLHLKLLDRVRRAQRAAGGVAQIGEVGLGAKFVRVFAPGRPRQRAEDEGADARVLQRGGRVLQEDDGAMFRALERPRLRLNVVNARALLAGGVLRLVHLLAFRHDLLPFRHLRRKGRAEDEHVVREVEVVERVVVHVEGRRIAHDRVRVGADVEHHAAGKFLARLRIPRPAERGLAPRHVAGRHRRAHRHDAAAALGESRERRLRRGGQRLKLRALKQHRVRLFQRRRIRHRQRRHHRAGFLQSGRVVRAELLCVARDQHPQRGGGEERRERENEEGGERGRFHGCG